MCQGTHPRYTQFLPHPSNGGTRGYDISFRELILENNQAGRPVPASLTRSVWRWARHIVPRRMTGNKPRSELSGEYLFLLVLFKMIWPHSSYYECIAFIANESDDARIFCLMAVSRALKKLEYTTKITSTVAYQAFTTRNLARRQMFWTEPWPVGIHGVPRRTMVDIDKFGLHLNAANKKYGSSPRGLEIRKPGNYDRGNFKLTVLLAVETGDPTIPAGEIGSVSYPCVWGRVNAVAGTSAEAYRTFVEHVLDTYDAINDPAQRRTLIHDNLSSHMAPEVYKAVRVWGHRVVCRPPYRPQDGPGEFAINQVCCGLARRWSEVSDLPTMQALVEELIDVGISGMDATFVKCGYIGN